jgi:hypothetical protein
MLYPLFGGELAPLSLILREVESGNLDRGQLLDPERVFAARLFIVLEAHVDLRPDPAGQQPIKVAHIVGRDVDMLAAEIDDLGPIVRIH